MLFSSAPAIGLLPAILYRRHPARPATNTILEGSVDAEYINHNRRDRTARRVWSIHAAGSADGAAGGGAGQCPAAEGAGRRYQQLCKLPRSAYCEQEDTGRSAVAVPSRE